MICSRIAIVLVASIGAMSPVQADECDAAAGEVVARYGGGVVRRNGQKIFIAHPSLESLAIECSSGVPIGVAAMSDKEYPPASVYFLAAGAASVALKQPALDKTREDLIACQSAAQRQRGKIVPLESPPLALQCGVDETGALIAIYKSGHAPKLQ